MTAPRRAADPRAIRYDLVLLGTALTLTAFGVVMVYSASGVYAAAKLGSSSYFLKRQALSAVVGVGALAAMLKLGYRRLEVLAVPLLGLALLSLVLIFVPGLGHAAGGSKRWLVLGPLTFQPAELAKLALVLFLARSLAKKGDAVKDWRVGFVPHAVVAGMLVLLLMGQPDFGTSVACVLITGALLFVAGVRVGYLFAALVVALPGAVFLVTHSAYRMRRILAFLDPWDDPNGVGYQVREALLSVGSGGPFGLGLGESRQKLFYLPAAHTDFILPIIGEELGLVGIAAVVALFALLAWRGLKAAYAAPDAFGAFLAIGLTSLLCFESLVNAGMAMGMLPTKGLALPFLSYGGTSLVATMMAVGILLSISGGPGGYLRAALGARP